MPDATGLELLARELRESEPESVRDTEHFRGKAALHVEPAAIRATLRFLRAKGFAFLASVLQRRHNHDTFVVHRVAVEDRPDLAERFGVNCSPTLVIVESKRVRGRLENPRGAQEISAFLAPWLKSRPPRRPHRPHTAKARASR